jgi:hypothetical protein
MTAGRKTHSQSLEWGTPQHLVDAVKLLFGGEISLDPCSNEFSVVGAVVEYRLPDVDGLKESWGYPTIYVNPPYGFDRERGTHIRDWLRRCADAHRSHGSEVVALIPVATNTAHWKQYVWGEAAGVAFLFDSRLKFLVNGRREGKGAPMSCAVVYWGARYNAFSDIFGGLGAAVDTRKLKSV